MSTAARTGEAITRSPWVKRSPCVKRLLHVQQRAEPAMERRRAAGDHARLEHLEQLLARGAEAHRPLHVRDERGLVRSTEGEQRDRDELAHLHGHVPALAVSELVDS